MHLYNAYLYTFIYICDFTDNAVWPRICADQFCDVVILRSHVLNGEGGRDEPAKLGVLHVRCLANRPVISELPIPAADMSPRTRTQCTDGPPGCFCIKLSTR